MIDEIEAAYAKGRRQAFEEAAERMAHVYANSSVQHICDMAIRLMREFNTKAKEASDADTTD